MVAVRFPDGSPAARPPPPSPPPPRPVSVLFFWVPSCFPSGSVVHCLVLSGVVSPLRSSSRAPGVEAVLLSVLAAEVLSVCILVHRVF